MAEMALDGDWAGLASFESDESNRPLFLMGAMAYSCSQLLLLLLLCLTL
jgi:hypothetical protein